MNSFIGCQVKWTAIQSSLSPSLPTKETTCILNQLPQKPLEGPTQQFPIELKIELERDREKEREGERERERKRERSGTRWAKTEAKLGECFLYHYFLLFSTSLPPSFSSPPLSTSVPIFLPSPLTALCWVSVWELRTKRHKWSHFSPIKTRVTWSKKHKIKNQQETKKNRKSKRLNIGMHTHRNQYRGDLI